MEGESRETARELLKELKTYGGQFAKLKPGIMKVMAVELKTAALGDGVLSQKAKELMALSIGVHARCKYCIVYHVRACIDLGCSDEEMAEACGVAVQMGGGPAMTYAAFAMKAIEELRG